MTLPDILIFMSDQHTPYYSGFYGKNTDTPAMDQLCEDGTCFTEAYTVCPLCVPSRASLLTGLRPARTGIFTLDDAIPDMTPTFLHYLVEQGYETVLAGRMHFVGADQRHGFTKRIAGDLTTISWNSPREKLKKSRGVFVRSFGEAFCTQLIGGGESPVDYYDEYVVQKAVNYLNQPHDKPQCVVVSLYAPHFPYVGPKKLYLKYRKKAILPASFYDPLPTPVLARHRQDVSEEVALGAQAAYCAMIEQLDRRLGQVRQAFQRFCEKRGTSHLFLYTSDHGDQCGDRRMFAKSTFYEKSAKIPLIIAGTNISKNHTVDTPVSIMDIGPTLLDYTGAQKMPEIDGVSLIDALHGGSGVNHVAYGEFLERADMGSPADSYCFMVKSGVYKYMCFHDDPEHEFLFDTVADPEERINLIQTLPKIAENTRNIAHRYQMAHKAVEIQKFHARNTKLWKAYEQAVGVSCDKERWEDIPDSCRNYPEICITSEVNH